MDSGRSKKKGAEPRHLRRVEAEEEPIRVNWDESRLRTAYANVCNVTSTREEVTLLFGTNQMFDAASRDLTVEVTGRVILNPYAAKRLQSVLHSVLAGYEERFGPISIEPR